MEIITKEFIFKEKEGINGCHASTVLKYGDKVIAAWFEGTQEKANDVKIKVSLRENGLWQETKTICALENTPHWNPVLFSYDNKIALYFKVGFEIKDWVTYVSYSFDGGYTFTKPQELIENDASGGRGPVKNKPLKLKSGRVLCPASSEKLNWLPFCDITDDNGISFKKITIPLVDVSLIQPSFWQSDDGSVHALMRSDKGYIYRSDSFDEGESWCKAYKTSLENNNSGLDLVKAENGNIYLVCNPVNENWGARSPLSIFISEDDGDSFKKLCDLETVKGEFSYPAIISEKDMLYITYTYNRKTIVYTEIKL
ncbi:MAG: exo-alpha-sialidase [Clostridia bacterium]|nr:exo-alpha-sialidase [Clostridia bacterium]